MNEFIGAVIRYMTNHFIAHFPSHTIRLAWYRHVLGWRIDPRVGILMGLYVQMAGVRTSGKKVVIGEGTVINQGCLLYTTGGLVIGKNVSISAGAWLVTGSHDMNDPQFPDFYKPITIYDY